MPTINKNISLTEDNKEATQDTTGTRPLQAQPIRISNEFGAVLVLSYEKVYLKKSFIMFRNKLIIIAIK